MKFRSQVAAIIFAGSALNAALDNVAIAETQLVVSSYLPENLFNSRTVKYFGNLVEERTKGEVKFKYFFNGSLANEKEALPMLSSGGIDIALITSSYYPADFPLSTLFDVPMLSNHMDATQKAAVELYEEHQAFRDEFGKLNVKPLMIMSADISPLGSNKRIETMDDLKGMRIRALGFLAHMVKSWGATPIALGSTEIFQSMQAGLIDGFTAQPLQDFRAKSLDTVTRYAVDTGIGIYHTGYFAINNDSLAKLSPEIQEIVEEAAKEANRRSNEINVENTRKAMPETLKNGVELYQLDAGVLQQMKAVGEEAATSAWLSQVVSSGVEEESAKSLLAQFKELIRKYDQEPEFLNYWDIYQAEAPR